MCDSLCAGATPEKIAGVIGVAVLLGEGPAMVYACEALEALEQFKAQERALTGGVRT